MAYSSSEVSTALIHLYRGELGRMTAYRIRLDSTTNWAVVTTAGMVSYALGTPAAPHFVLVLAIVLDLFFVGIEARRYCSFELIRQRVRLLERGFCVDVLGGRPDAAWQSELRASLTAPEMPLTLRAAVGIRLRRSYLGLIAVVFMAWVLKLVVHGTKPLPDAARVSGMPGSAVFAGVLVFFAALALVALRQRAPEEG